MHYARIVSAVALGFLLHACAPIPVKATPPADTSFVKEGVTRQQVEETVGPPDECESLGPQDLRLCTYEHYGSQAVVVLIGLFPPFFLPLPDLTQAQERAALHVLYRPDDVVKAASGGSRLVFHDFARLWVRAEAGERDAQYEISKSVRKPKEAYGWLCLAASQGLAKASADLGDINRHGAPGMQPDPARAYRWWVQAERQGHAAASSPRLEAARHLSADQIAEAERLAAAWQPDDCTAEVEQAFEAQVAAGTSRQGDLREGVKAHRYWTSLCLAAHAGDPDAQEQIGRRYEYGNDPVARDLVTAYVWYRLAQQNGYEGGSGSTYRRTKTGWRCCFPRKSRAEALAEALSEAELAKAERLLAKWRPDPAACGADEADLAAGP